MERKTNIGVWDFDGNYVEYHGGPTAYDEDSGENIPVSLLFAHGTFLRPFTAEN